MALAVIKTGGKQYIVKKDDAIYIEILKDVKTGDKVTFDSVLLTDDDKVTKLGNPLISGAKVSGTVIREGRAKKIEVVKYKAKSRYLKRRGHRQRYLKVHIDTI